MSGTRSLFAGLSVKAAEEQDPFRPGSYIQAFQIVEELKGGSMGRVFKCRHPQTGAYVVLKTAVTGTFLREDALRSFDTELLNWSALPLHTGHIVSIYGAMYDYKSGMPFVVMDWIEGSPAFGLTLKQWMQHGYPFSEKEVQYIALSVCTAIKDAEDLMEQRVIHGDIKPDNLFLRYNGENSEKTACLNSTVMLADMGCNGYTKAYCPEDQSGLPTTGTDVFAFRKVMEELAPYCTDKTPWYEQVLCVIRTHYEKNGDTASLAELYQPILALCDEDIKAMFAREKTTRADQILYQAQKFIMQSTYVTFTEEEYTAGLERYSALLAEAREKDYVYYGEPLWVILAGWEYRFLADTFLLQDGLQYLVMSRGKRRAAKLCRTVMEPMVKLLREPQMKYLSLFSGDPEEEKRILQGLFFSQLGETDTASAFFEKVSLEKCCSFRWVKSYAEVCRTYISRYGDPSEAESLLEKLRKERQNRESDRSGAGNALDAWVLSRQYGSLLRDMGQTAEAAAVHEACWRAYPASPGILFDYGETLLLNGQTARGRMLFERYCRQYRETYEQISATVTAKTGVNRVLTDYVKACYYCGRFAEGMDAAVPYRGAGIPLKEMGFRNLTVTNLKIYADMQFEKKWGSDAGKAGYLCAKYRKKVASLWEELHKDCEKPDWHIRKLEHWGEFHRLFRMSLVLFRALRRMAEEEPESNTFIIHFGTKLLREFQDEAMLWQAVGCAYIFRGDPAAAAAHLQKAIEYMPCEYPNYDDPDTPTPECLQKRKEIQNLIEGLHF